EQASAASGGRGGGRARRWCGRRQNLGATHHDRGPLGSLGTGRPDYAGRHRGSSGGLEAPMVVGHGYPAAGGMGRGQMRAADADRDRAVSFLTTAYTEGRLGKDENEAALAWSWS